MFAFYSYFNEQTRILHFMVWNFKFWSIYTSQNVPINPFNSLCYHTQVIMIRTPNPMILTIFSHRAHCHWLQSLQATTDFLSWNFMFWPPPPHPFVSASSSHHFTQFQWFLIYLCFGLVWFLLCFEFKCFQLFWLI